MELGMAFAHMAPIYGAISWLRGSSQGGGSQVRF